MASPRRSYPARHFRARLSHSAATRLEFTAIEAGQSTETLFLSPLRGRFHVGQNAPPLVPWAAFLRS
jgi:hypothetical protein